MNDDVEDGVTVHWHGVDVPNAEDGVAGVTQDAVPAGRAARVPLPRGAGGHVLVPQPPVSRRSRSGAGSSGRSWSSRGERRQRTGSTSPSSRTSSAAARRWTATTELRRRPVPAGHAACGCGWSTPTARRGASRLGGTPFRVLAIDGTDLQRADAADRHALELAAGGRYDVGFTMPRRPVTLALARTDAASCSARTEQRRRDAEDEPTFDPLALRRPAPTPFDAREPFDRSFKFEIGRKPGFLDGRPGRHWTINGGIYPDVPVFVVREGRPRQGHDRQRHGSRPPDAPARPPHARPPHATAAPVTGSPWWADTLDVAPGERYEVAFRADNPGSGWITATTSRTPPRD